MLAASALATGGFLTARSITLLRLEGKMDARLQAAVWDRLLSLPAPFFRRYSAGDLTMRANVFRFIRQVLTAATAPPNSARGCYRLGSLTSNKTVAILEVE